MKLNVPSTLMTPLISFLLLGDDIRHRATALDKNFNCLKSGRYNQTKQSEVNIMCLLAENWR